MEASSFEKAVCLQFNALMMIVIKGTLSSHRRQSARRSKHEVLFCELSEMKRMEMVQMMNIFPILYRFKL